MTDEAAKALAEAINRMAAALERITCGLGGGIQHYHNGLQAPAQFTRDYWQGQTPPYQAGRSNT